MDVINACLYQTICLLLRWRGDAEERASAEDSALKNEKRRAGITIGYGRAKLFCVPID